MSESYSDRWKREFLEQHPEKAAEHQRGQARYSVPAHRGQPLPATSSPAHQPPYSLNPVLTAQGQAQSTPSCRSQGHSAAQATLPQHGDRASCQDIQALVSAACKLRYRLRLTQRAFAEQLGINPRTWQEWEQGRRLPTGPGKALLEQWLARHQGT